MDSLLAKLERAGEGSRELSDDVLFATGWTCSKPLLYEGQPTGDKLWHGPDGKLFGLDRPDPTRSMDAAMSLVPSGHWWIINSGVHDKLATALVDARKPWEHHEARAATPALALTIAALRARRME